jgi:hypothetical protein
MANQYLQELGHFSMDQLKRQPSEEEWSLGQMVQNLINSALYMQIRNMERCMMEGETSAVHSMKKIGKGKITWLRIILRP